MTGNERMSFRRAREQIAETVEAGADLEDLENGLFERVALSRDARDALWLFAWGAIERREDRNSAQTWRR